MDKLNIQLNDVGKIWFTSDPHYDHKNILRFNERPFNTIESMNEALINNWNNNIFWFFNPGQ